MSDNNYTRLDDTISSHEGKAFATIDGQNRELFELSKLNAQIDLNVISKRMLGHRMTQHKVAVMVYISPPVPTLNSCRMTTIPLSPGVMDKGVFVKKLRYAPGRILFWLVHDPAISQPSFLNICIGFLRLHWH